MAVCAGAVGGQALALGLVDVVAMDVVPVVFGRGKRYFGGVDGQHLLEDPDLMIQGDGFFVVENSSERLYTRAGAFTFDESGTLVTPDGNRVMGYGLNPDGTPDGVLRPITLDTSKTVPAAGPGVELVSPPSRVRP